MAVFNNILNGASGQAGGAGAGYQIERSLRFNTADTSYLNRVASSTGNRKTWTWSGWIKRTKPGAWGYPFDTNDRSQYVTLQFLGSGDIDHIRLYMDGFSPSTPASILLVTDAEFKDPSAWMHLIVAVDTTQATASDRVKIYINGVAQTFKSGSYPPQDGQTAMNKTGCDHAISRRVGQNTYFDGYLAEIHHVDGQQLDQYDFGEFDANGVWQPIEYTGTYGTNGYYLDFSDNSSTTTIAEDSSGNGNNFTAYNISVAAGANNDSLFDSPTNGTQTDTGAGGEVSGNYCTWNSLQLGTSASLSNGNLKVDHGSGIGTTLGTIGVSSGKWYWEVTHNGGTYLMIGVAKPEVATTAYLGSTLDGYGYFDTGGQKYNYSSSNYGASYTTNDVIGVALDMDAGTLTFYKNGASQGTAFTGLSGTLLPAVGDAGGGATPKCIANFGQRPFAYTAPSGFKALCTANLDDPTIADGSSYFTAVGYAGNSGDGLSTTQDITTTFSPDLVWIKDRTGTNSNHLFDTIRGAGKRIFSNSTAAETDVISTLSAFNSDGFTVNGNNAVNDVGSNYISWNWDAGTSTVSNTDGSITSSVRANQTAGFSIVSWTGTGSNATIGHGLNSEPYLVVIKNRSTVSDWVVYNNSVGATRALFLQSSSAGTTASTFFQNTAPTSSVFSTGTNNGVALSGSNFIAYCFAPVEGYSAFGSYTGNGSADGPFVYTGFKPRWILVKASSASESWIIMDTAREPSNVAEDALYANLSDAETAAYTDFDILSNGFKLRRSGTDGNYSSRNYIYAAFAENPFKYARAR